MVFESFWNLRMFFSWRIARIDVSYKHFLLNRLSTGLSDQHLLFFIFLFNILVQNVHYVYCYQMTKNYVN